MACEETAAGERWFTTLVQQRDHRRRRERRVGRQPGLTERQEEARHEQRPPARKRDLGLPDTERERERHAARR